MDSGTMTTMAKKKPGVRSPKNKERAGPGFTSKAIRMSDAYAEWLEQFAKANRSTFAGFIDRLLAETAKDQGFKPPPERIP